MKNLTTIATILFLFLGFNLSAKTPDSTAKQRIQKILNSLPDSSTYSQIEDAIYKVNPEQVWQNEAGRWFFGIAGVFALFSLWFMLKGIKVNGGILIQPTKVFFWDGVLYAVWIIVPPIWFLFEYIWMFDDKYKMHSNYLNDIQYTQDLASKVWGALFVLFGGILYLKYAYKKGNQ